MKNQLFFVLSLLNSGQIFLAYYDRTIMSQLQELCPYTSFCEENATMYFPKSATKRPCCEPCSCKPGCEKDDNCCFRRNDPGRICVPPTTNKKAPIVKYMMIHSCLSNFNLSYDSNSTMCSYNDSDYKSFAPVVSKNSGEIFVNLECATCNQVHDIVPWTLTINCLPGIDGPRNEIIRLLNGEQFVSDRCLLLYIPPKHFNLESHQCRNDVIRECNVSGESLEWEPLWEHCPLLNAPFSESGQMYGNIFCFLCNERYSYPIKPICQRGGYTGLTHMGFSALIENTDFMKENSKPVKSSSPCGPTEMLVHSIKVECREVECSLGKIRIGGKCGFFSKKWIGGVFIAVLKLSPLDKTKKIDISILSHLQTSYKDDRKATWLKRNTMKNWNVEALYRPSSDNKYIEYFVTRLSFPRPSVNPAILWTSLSKAMKNIWTLNTKVDTISLRVQFNSHENYKKKKQKALRKYGIHIDEEYGYVRNSYITEYDRNEEEYLLAVFPYDDPIIANREYLNELFLCDLIELRPDEFSKNNEQLIFLTTSNVTLQRAEFRIFQSKQPLVCLSRLHQNTNLSCVHYFQIFGFIIVLWVVSEYNISI